MLTCFGVPRRPLGLLPHPPLPFSRALPRRARPPQPQPAGHCPLPDENGDMTPPLCVLVVDDDPDTARMWCLLLSGWGHRPLLAYDAAAARAVASAEKPDVVLADIG